MIDHQTTYTSDILDVIGNVVNSINSNHLLGAKKTIFERSLDLFRMKGQIGVSATELKNLICEFGSVEDVDTGLSKLISRLRAKLIEYSYTIVSYKTKDKSLWYVIIRIPGG